MKLKQHARILPLDIKADSNYIKFEPLLTAFPVEELTSENYYATKFVSQLDLLRKQLRRWGTCPDAEWLITVTYEYWSPTYDAQVDLPWTFGPNLKIGNSGATPCSTAFTEFFVSVSDLSPTASALEAVMATVDLGECGSTLPVISPQVPAGTPTISLVDGGVMALTSETLRRPIQPYTRGWVLLMHVWGECHCVKVSSSTCDCN